MAILPTNQEAKWILEEQLQVGEYLEHVACGTSQTPEARLLESFIGSIVGYGVSWMAFSPFNHWVQFKSRQDLFMVSTVIVTMLVALPFAFRKACVVGLTNRSLIFVATRPRWMGIRRSDSLPYYRWRLDNLPDADVWVSRTRARLRVTSEQGKITIAFAEDPTGAWRSDLREAKEIIEVLTRSDQAKLNISWGTDLD